MVDYRPRTIDVEVAARLEWAGGVLVEGPKGCGKTSSARQVARSEIRLDADPRRKALYESDPELILDGATPRLVDEWQAVPESWNAVRHAIDDRSVPGQFILTGSATPSDDATRHSGAGRISRLRMYPMTLHESGDSTGTVSFAALLSGERPRSLGSDVGLAQVAEALCRGGWPLNLGLDPDQARQRNRDYLRTLASVDVVTVDGVRRDPRRVEALIFALARNSATYVTKKTLRADAADFEAALSGPTLDAYLDALIRLWIAVPQVAWGQHLRSSAQVRRLPKWHLVDPSLAAAILGATPRSLVDDPEVFGQLFESLALRDLQVYAQAAGAEVRAYHDSADREIDVVVVRDGEWHGIEVKLSSAPTVVDTAAVKLRAIAEGMRKPPTSLTVITATGPCYRRDDGVNVVSLVSLAP